LEWVKVRARKPEIIFCIFVSYAMPYALCAMRFSNLAGVFALAYAQSFDFPSVAVYIIAGGSSTWRSIVEGKLAPNR
jgi:hypothetical protein